MSVATQISQAIKRALGARGRTYAWLARELSISESSVKRLLSKGGISLERLDAICVALDLELGDLINLAQVCPDVRELTVEQEQALADHPVMLAVFYMLLNGWSAERAGKSCRLTASALVSVLARLDRIRVVELLAHNRVRLRVPKDHLWRPNGPLRKRYRQEALQEFFQSRFSDADEYLRFEIGLMGNDGVRQLKRRIDRLAQEFNGVSDVDARLPPEDATKPIAVVLALRPWDPLWIVRHAQRPRSIKVR